MEAFSLAPSSEFACVVNPENYGAYYAQSQECPPLHIFLLNLCASILNILGDHDWMLVIFTGILAIFTGRLWFTTERDTRILQRAYLSVIPRGVEQYKSLNGMLSCDVAFFNAGNLPAQNVQWIIHREFDVNGLREKFELTKAFSGNNIIPPKSEMRKGGKSSSWRTGKGFKKVLQAFSGEGGGARQFGSGSFAQRCFRRQPRSAVSHSFGIC